MIKDESIAKNLISQEDCENIRSHYKLKLPCCITLKLQRNPFFRFFVVFSDNSSIIRVYGEKNEPEKVLPVPELSELTVEFGDTSKKPGFNSRKDLYKRKGAGRHQTTRKRKRNGRFCKATKCVRTPGFIKAS